MSIIKFNKNTTLFPKLSRLYSLIGQKRFSGFITVAPEKFWRGFEFADRFEKYFSRGFNFANYGL